jgi:hypothetical protein
MDYKLGKLPAVKDKRTLKLKDYLPKKLPPIPAEVRWDKIKAPTAWGMDGNDRFGNCVICTAAHIVDCSRENEGAVNKRRISDASVISLTHTLGAEDGYVVLDRLKYWRNTGMWRTKIKAFTSVQAYDSDQVRSAINIFGHCDIGLQMPRAWQGQSLWNTGGGSDYRKGSWGGHSVPLFGYHQDPTLGLVYSLCTWGEIIFITAEALAAYCDEAYVSILPAWYAKDGKTPSGFKWAELEADLEEL